MTGTDDPTPYADLLEVARTVALEAAAMVKERRRRGVEVSETKTSPTDIVTEVDKASEELIHGRLMSLRPGDGFLGEEGSSSESSTGVTWVVDPIDGTVNFLYGIPKYAVSIAASRDGEVVAGVVLDVQSGELFSATLGGGATLDGMPLEVRRDVPVSERLVGTGFNYVPERRIAQADAVARMLREVRDLRRIGSAALDLCYVGAGRFDAYVEEGLRPWDSAAGGLVATEAGAVVETFKGVGGMDCVVCAPADGYAEFLDVVRRSGFLADE